MRRLEERNSICTNLIMTDDYSPSLTRKNKTIKPIVRTRSNSNIIMGKKKRPKTSYNERPVTRLPNPGSRTGSMLGRPYSSHVKRPGNGMASMRRDGRASMGGRGVSAPRNDKLKNAKKKDKRMRRRSQNFFSHNHHYHYHHQVRRRNRNLSFNEKIGRRSHDLFLAQEIKSPVVNMRGFRLGEGRVTTLREFQREMDERKRKRQIRLMDKKREIMRIKTPKGSHYLYNNNTNNGGNGTHEVGEVRNERIDSGGKKDNGIKRKGSGNVNKMRKSKKKKTDYDNRKIGSKKNGRLREDESGEKKLKNSARRKSNSNNSKKKKRGSLSNEKLNNNNNSLFNDEKMRGGYHGGGVYKFNEIKENRSSNLNFSDSKTKNGNTSYNQIYENSNGKHSNDFRLSSSETNFGVVTSTKRNQKYRFSINDGNKNSPWCCRSQKKVYYTFKRVANEAMIKNNNSKNIKILKRSISKMIKTIAPVYNNNYSQYKQSRDDFNCTSNNSDKHGSKSLLYFKIQIINVLNILEKIIIVFGVNEQKRIMNPLIVLFCVNTLQSFIKEGLLVFDIPLSIFIKLTAVNNNNKLEIDEVSGLTCFEYEVFGKKKISIVSKVVGVLTTAFYSLWEKTLHKKICLTLIELMKIYGKTIAEIDIKRDENNYFLKRMRKNEKHQLITKQMSKILLLSSVKDSKLDLSIEFFGLLLQNCTKRIMGMQYFQYCEVLNENLKQLLIYMIINTKKNECVRISERLLSFCVRNKNFGHNEKSKLLRFIRNIFERKEKNKNNGFWLVYPFCCYLQKEILNRICDLGEKANTLRKKRKYCNVKIMFEMY